MSASVKFHFFCAPRLFSSPKRRKFFEPRSYLRRDINEENCIRFEKKLKSGYE
jgi:hypothetical protein